MYFGRPRSLNNVKFEILKLCWSKGYGTRMRKLPSEVNLKK